MYNIALEFKDVTGKGFGFKLKNVSMTLENGYIYAVTGKNGAGKTTLFNYILTEKKRIYRQHKAVRLRACWKSCKSNGNHRAGVRG